MIIGVNTILTRIGGVFKSYIKDGLKVFYNFKDTTPSFLLSGSTSFDGTDDYISISDDNSLDFGTGDFSVSLWATTTKTSFGWAIDKSETKFGIGQNADGTLRLWIGASNHNGTTSFNDGLFHHIAISRGNGTLKAYIDGVEDLSVSNTGDVDSSASLYIGQWSSGADYWNGKIANVGLWNRALSASEIESIYWRGSYSELKDTELTNLVSWYDLQGDVLDKQGSNNGTNNGATLNSNSYSGESPFKPRIQDIAKPKLAVQLADGSTSFDGADSYVNCGSDSSLDNIFNGGGTVSAWIFPESDGEGNEGRIMEKRDTGDGWTFVTREESSGSCKLRLFINYSSTNGIYTSGADVTINAWNHIALVYDSSGAGSSYRPVIYINGSVSALSATTDSVGTADSDASEDFTIGGNKTPLDRVFDGKIANVSVHSSSLTQTQIQELMFTEKYSGLSSDLKTNLVSWYDLGSTEYETGVAPSSISGDGTQDFSDGLLTVASNATYSAITLTQDLYYKITYTIESYTSGSVNVSFSTGSTSGTSRSSTGTFSETGTITGNASFYFIYSSFVGTIKDITIQELILPDSVSTNNGSIYGATTTTGYTSSPHGVVDPLNYGEVYSGRALDFDGSNDYVSIPDDNSLSFGDGSSDSPFSVSSWVLMDAVARFTICTKGVSNGGNWEYMVAGSGTNLDFYLWDESSDGAHYVNIAGATLTPYVGQWIYIVATYDGSGNRSGMKMYINGVSQTLGGASDGSYTAMENLGGSYDIGKERTFYTNGKIQNQKVFNVELTEAQVQELYTKPETVLPTGVSASNLKLDLPMQEGAGSYIYDGSGNQNHGTISGATWATGESDGYQSSLVRSNTPMVFDGSDDYVQIMSNGKGTFSNQSFTISAWIKPNAVSSDKVIFSYDHTSHTDPHYAMHLRTMSSGRVTLDYNNGSGSGASTTSGNSAITAGVWQHICATYTSGTQKVYVNGSVVASGTDAYTITFYDQEVWIGKANFGGSEFDGLINEVAVWDVALDADAVTALYGSGTPLLPTSDSGNYDNSDDLQGYWRNDGIATWTDRTPLGVYGSEFLTNGDFSSFSSGQATSWTTTGSPTLSEETTIVQSGSSQKIFMGSSGNNGIDQTVTTVAGKKYQFSAKVYVTGGRARIIFDNGSDDGQTYVGTGGSTGYEALNTWHTITHIKTAESTSVTARIWTSSANTTVYVDDVSIKRYRGGNDGTASGSPVSIVIPEGSTSGRDNQGFLLSDTTSISNGMRFYKNEYINVGDSEVLSFGDNIDDKPFSIEAWIYMNDSSVGNFCIVSKMTTQDDNGEYFFLVNSDEKLYLLLNEDDEASGEYGATPSLASYNKQWIHCVGTYDGRGGASACDGINIYINGSAQSLTRSGFGSYTAMNNTSADFIIGKRTGLAGQEADGMIDEVRIYQKELSASEVTKNYNNGKSAHQ